MLKAVSSIATSERGWAGSLSPLRSLLDFRYLVLLTAIATYALIVLGGTVRVTDSGLACPDWPLCHGQLIPPLERHILIEYSHRLAAAAVGFLVLGVAITAWLSQRQNRALLAGAVGALLLLVVQVLVGGVTVNMELPDTIVALHLGIALSLLAVLVVTATTAFWRRRPSTANGPVTARQTSAEGLPLLAGAAALATFALILTGSYVANSGAGLVYQDWPLFNGSLLSAGGRLADLHYAHRLMAVVVGLLLLAVVVRVWGRRRSPVLLAALGAALALYLAQVLVGASNVWFELASSLRIAHLALASALWATLILGVTWAYLERREAQERG